MKLSSEQINKIMQLIWYYHSKNSNGYLDFNTVKKALKDFTFKIDENNFSDIFDKRLNITKEKNDSTQEEKYDKMLKERVEKHNKQLKVGDEVLYVLPIISQDTKEQFEYIICKVEIKEINLEKQTASVLIKDVIREVTGNGIMRYYQRKEIEHTTSLQYLYKKDDGKLGQ